MVVLPDEIAITNADSTRERLRSAFSPGAMIVIADMTSTALCDMSGWRSLLSATEDAAAARGQASPEPARP